MNERIESLIELAEVWNTDGDVDKCEVDLHKFAELIVRECMEQVWCTREDVINGNISEVIKDRIKQHFGVEE